MGVSPEIQKIPARRLLRVRDLIRSNRVVVRFLVLIVCVSCGGRRSLRLLFVGQLLASETEREVLEILGVPWQEPHERVRANFV